MAYLFKRVRSPFWWIGFEDCGKRKQESTKLRHAVPLETRRAREMCDAMTVHEHSPFTRDEMWGNWVPAFLERRYRNSPHTLRRYQGGWRFISIFLQINQVTVPRQLTRKHVNAFVDWRQHGHPDAGCYKASHNTALQDVKLLRLVMHEAVANEFANSNPCTRLGDRPDPVPKKPRITEAEHERILQALGNEPEWMLTSYMIAWEQGCRFSETCLPLSDVDLDRMVIGFRVKGRKDSVSEFPLSPKLVPMFRKFKNEGRKQTFVMPVGASQRWSRFFTRIGLSHICFHCCRVTFVTRCEESGLTAEEAMRLVGHSSYQVHKVYRRMKADHQTVQAMRKRLV